MKRLLGLMALLVLSTVGPMAKPVVADAAIWKCGPAIMRVACVNWGNGHPPATGSITINTGTVGIVQSLAKIGTDQTIQIDVTEANNSYWTNMNSIPLYSYRWPDDRTDQWHCYDDTKKTGDCNANNVTQSANLAAAAPCISNPSSGCATCITTYNSNSGSNTGFDSYMGEVAEISGAQSFQSANYGTNYDCTGAGDPTEAAGWAAYCYTTYSTACTHMTIGTEIYNCQKAVGVQPVGLCRDNHGVCTQNSLGQCTTNGSKAGDGATYGAAYATYQNDIHTSTSNNVSTCVLGDPQQPHSKWDQPVAAALTVTPDCQEIECYTASVFNNISDTFALNNAAFDCDNSTVTSGPTGSTALMAIALTNYPSVPIYIDQWGLYSSNPLPASQSITNALFYAEQMMQYQLDPNIVGATYHTAQGSACYLSGYTVDGSGNPQYGWQNQLAGNSFGAADSFSSNKTGQCADYQTPLYDAMATAYSMQVVKNSINGGSNHMLGCTVSGVSGVYAWCAQDGSGYTIFAVNTNYNSSATVNLVISSKASGTGVTSLTYDKAQYDNVGICSPFGAGTCWSLYPPISASSGAWTTNIPETLPPGSETSFVIN